MGKVLAIQAWRATLDPQHPCQKAGRSGAHLQSQGQGGRDRRISRTYCIGKPAYHYWQAGSSMRDSISKSDMDQNGGRWWMTISSLHVIVCTHTRTHTHECTHICTYMHTHVYTHVYTHARTCIRSCTYTCV